MKKIVLAATLLLSMTTGIFAQSDLQPLAIVKLNKSETITLKQLKNRVETYQKQNNMTAFTVDQKKEILDAMIDEKLVVQAATKAGMNITDTQVNQYFLQNISQQVGKQVTEAEFSEIVKKQTGKSLDDFMKEQVGMNVTDYKAYLKNQLLAQQYVMQQKQEDIKKASPKDEDIRKFYDLNKASFVQNDMVKLFLVVVPKGSNSEGAKIKAEALKKGVTDKSLSYEKIKADSGKDYQGGDLFIGKTAQHAQQLGISYNDLLELFTRDIGYMSNLNETETDFQFYVVRQKYPAKMLAISDLVQPETTTTVYDYIKLNLTNQMQSQALVAAVQNITKGLRTPSNFEYKQKEEKLKKLLDWK
ncbi:peptidyl-prolyl cis-trans isomerase [Treponema sp.]|uniref:MOSP complex formation periplasmic protein, TDE1658 family n=1 Tax=Treponema sp. TaxID=166 RepID=UPI00389088BA